MFHLVPLNNSFVAMLVNNLGQAALGGSSGPGARVHANGVGQRRQTIFTRCFSELPKHRSYGIATICNSYAKIAALSK